MCPWGMKDVLMGILNVYHSDILAGECAEVDQT